MYIIDHNKTPLFSALKKYVNDGVIPLHVPGHKQGKGIPELTEFFGTNVMSFDVNGMEDLDNICNPINVIKESENLLADLYKADYSFFLVNGTTQGVQTMIMHTCRPGDEILVPRNAHKSVIGGIILSGAIPVYIQPEINYELGIAMGISVESVKRAIVKHPNATAILVINPTYYGIASDLKEIINIAHKNNLYVLVDEAHGSHLPLSESLPDSGMDLGADMSSVSIHKTGGAMTQSSVLLIKGEKLNYLSVKSTLNLTQTTSASYVLMASIDIARKQMAINGKKIIQNIIELTDYARERINRINGLYAFGQELTGTPGSYAFDSTKLNIHVRKLGLTGYEMESLLRTEYNIQIELSDLYNVMAIISMGDNEDTINAFINALEDIASKRKVEEPRNNKFIPFKPKVVISPRDAYYSLKKAVKLKDAVGEISGEMIMAYPPGIPVIIPGEKISQEVVEYVQILKNEHCQLQGTEDPYVDYIYVLGE